MYQWQKYFQVQQTEQKNEDTNNRDVTAGPGCRPGTGGTGSDSLIHDTLCSRMDHQPTPTGVPPLNISLDADNIRWLQDQQQQTRRGRTRSPPGKTIVNQEPPGSVKHETSKTFAANESLAATKRRIGE